MPIHQVKSHKADPIDAVIAWVDGDDPNLKAKRNQYLGVDDSFDKHTRERFSEVGELYFCIALILKNAPFINRIFVVTDNQYPPHIDKIRENFGGEAFSKIRLVDHSIIFEGHEEHLPVFNSVSIETLIHKIPNLSSRYIYFNDDFFIVRQVNETDFFDGERPVLRGRIRPAKTALYHQNQRERRRKGEFALSHKKFSYKETQYLSFAMLGIQDKYFWHDHTPFSFYKPTVEKLEREFMSEFSQNIAYRERHHSQWDIMAAAAAMEIVNGNNDFRNPSLTYMKPSAKRFQRAYVWRKKLRLRRRKNKFLCIQSLSEAKPHTQKLCENMLNDLVRTSTA